MLLGKLSELNLLNPPKWLVSNCQWVVLSGSYSYGCHTESSDKDYVGYAIPPLEDLFPFSHGGKIYGFDEVNNFNQYLERSKFHNDYIESDWSIYNIVKIFSLLLDNNPNCLDMLFVPQNCIIHSTRVGELVRSNRHLFLSKKLYHTHRGYSYKMLHKAKSKNPVVGSNRDKLCKIYGMDTKYLYNVFRLLSQCEQYLETGDVDLQRDREIYKDIRSGGWSLERMDDWFQSKEKHLNFLYENCTVLPHSPVVGEIRSLLLSCLEEWYGDISKFVKVGGKELLAIRQIKDLLSDF